MYFYIKDFMMKKAFLFKKRYVSFKYFSGYKWKKLKVQIPLSFNSDVSFYTSTILNSVQEDLTKINGLEEYKKIIPFFEQLNRELLLNSTKIGR